MSNNNTPSVFVHARHPPGSPVEVHGMDSSAHAHTHENCHDDSTALPIHHVHHSQNEIVDIHGYSGNPASAHSHSHGQGDDSTASLVHHVHHSQTEIVHVSPEYAGSPPRSNGALADPSTPIHHVQHSHAQAHAHDHDHGDCCDSHHDHQHHTVDPSQYTPIDLDHSHSHSHAHDDSKGLPIHHVHHSEQEPVQVDHHVHVVPQVEFVEK